MLSLTGRAYMTYEQNWVDLREPREARDFRFRLKHSTETEPKVSHEISPSSVANVLKLILKRAYILRNN